MQQNHTQPAAVKAVESPSPHQRWGIWPGVALTLIIAVAADLAARAPILSMMGVMILSIVIGVFWKTAVHVPAAAASGIAFSSKYLLRAGIILMGLRLNFSDIIAAGWRVALIDIVVIGFTLSFMIALGRRLRVDRRLGALIAVGTAVCGAAAIAAVAPMIGAKKESTALSVATVAVLGTVGTILYVLIYPFIGTDGADAYLYGVFAGSTLHELAHVIAAGAPAGDVGAGAAILVKLGRVALLIPVALGLGLWFQRGAAAEERKTASRGKRLPIPWFVFGFLAMSFVNTMGLLPQPAVDALIAVSVLLLSAAMAGLGLSIDLADFKKLGRNAVMTAVTGYLALAAVGAALTALLY